MAGNSAEAGQSVTSKVVAILLTFADGEVHTLTEVARLADLPTSTVHRLIGELAASGALERTDGSRYRVGGRLKSVCLRAPHTWGLQERGGRMMEDLSAVVHASVRLGILADGRVCYIEKKSEAAPVTTYSDGCVAPAHATSMGKVLLAFSPRHTVDETIEKGLKTYTPHTITSVEQLLRMLCTVRLSRVAVSRSEWVTGLSTLAVPVCGFGGRVIAALELSVRDLRADMRALHPVLTVAARSLSRDLAGWRAVAHPPGTGSRARMVSLLESPRDVVCEPMIAGL